MEKIENNIDEIKNKEDQIKLLRKEILQLKKMNKKKDDIKNDDNSDESNDKNKKRVGRPKAVEKNEKNWRILYLNPTNKLPIQIEEYKTVEEVANKLGVTTAVVYNMHKMQQKRYEFIKVERINENN